MVSKGQILNGRYRLLALEGEGGMADVYRAQDTTLDRVVALKILRAEGEGTDAFQEEARAIARLPHPNIVAVYDVCQDGDVQYIVMEYAEGKTLKQLLQNEGPLRIGQAVDIATQVCEAVGYAHRKGIVHCDIKPQNILIQPDGKVKVTDFGIAHAFSTGTPEQRKPWGTPFYVSPELVSGKQQTPASDVYAIGVVLYEILSGRVPFEGQTAAEIARQHVINAPPPIEQVNPRVTRYLRQVIDRALAKDPAQRYANAEELGKALQAYRQHSLNATQPLPQPVAAEAAPVRDAAAPSQPQTMVPPARRRRVDWVLLLLAALAFLMVMGLLPLWGTIISRALVPPTPVAVQSDPSTPTPTQDLTQINTPALLTSTPQPNVIVPPLVGLELEAARQRAGEAGLVLTLNGQRHSLKVPASHIIEQTPVADQEVAPGTAIGIIVSLGAEMVTMPDALGFPGAIKRLDLEDLGLVVAITETASIEPTGLVISQTPAAGTAITKGSEVTLTVSSGQQDQVRANLGNKVMLSKCELNDQEFRPGDVIQVLITWDVLESFPESYTVFIHIIDRNGQILTQRDAAPLGGSRPTNTWRPGETLLDTHTLVLPREASPGDYWVAIGLYQGDQRLPVIDPGLAEAKGNAVVARQITIKTN